MNFKNTLYTLSIVGLLMYCMMNFIITSQSNNGVTNGIINDPSINETFSDLSTSLNNAKSNSETSYGNFSKTPPTQEFGELKVSAITSITSTGKALSTGLWTTFIEMPLKHGIVPQVITDNIESLLLITLAIALWLLWKGVGVST